MLEVKEIHTYYGASHILRGVSITVGKGQIVALLGRNGMGKTTLLRSIIGLTRPRSGEVHFDGRRIDQMSAHHIAEGGIGYVPQGRRIFSSLTTQENLQVVHRNRGSNPWSIERILELFPSLRERLHTRAGALSGGEQQMLAVGRALATDPGILLMDEPTEGLAPRIVSEVQDTVERLRNEGTPILLVEQNTAFALALADYVYILGKGEIVYESAASEFMDHHELRRFFLDMSEASARS